jgi:glucose-1-phosphate adenylyltransferase
VFTPTITNTNSYWYRGTADALYQNLKFLKESHEPYVVIASGDGIYKLDYNKVLEYHIEKGADITVVCKDLVNEPEQLERFGVVQTNDDGRITEFEEKPLAASSTVASIGVYVVRRRALIELLENCAKEERMDFVKDILVRHKNVKKIYAYMMDSYWSNISDVDAYYKTNMDFLDKHVRDYFFKQYPDVYSKVDDLPPAKYNKGSEVRNSLISSGCIINGTVENSVLFKEVFVGSNCIIKNSIILNDVYIGDNVHIENCIVESRDTIRANSTHIGENGRLKIIVEKNSRYTV